MLIVIAGPNGPGKTEFTATVLEHEWLKGCKYVNPDNIARDEFGDWNSPQAVLLALRHAEELRYECLENLHSLAFETVLSTGEKVDFIKKTIDARFFTRLFFIGTDAHNVDWPTLRAST